MAKLVYIICVVLFSGVLRVHSLQCYQCEKCSTVAADQLVTCGVPTTTTSTTTTAAPGETTTTTTTESTTTTATTPTTTASTGSSVGVAENWVCLSMTYTANSTEVVDKGCALDLGNELRHCPAPSKNVVCHFCDSDGCNGASTMQISTFLIAFATAIKLMCKL